MTANESPAIKDPVSKSAWTGDEAESCGFGVIPLASVAPSGSLELLSQQEIARLRETAQGELYELFRRCALAVLNCDELSDSAEEVFQQYADFEVEIVQRTRGIKLELKNAPACAFVDGKLMRGVRDHLFAVLRDIVFVASEMYRLGEEGRWGWGAGTLDQTAAVQNDVQTRNLVFHILRNAGLMLPRKPPSMVVCWGGHAISREEYDYSKSVGYQLGLRGMDICTGCGPGAMKGPMKGAAVGHAKQRNNTGRYVGITEPGIVAAESPNPIVNHLVVLPDIEKRLEAFVRFGHGIIVFPGGAGTLEEILFLLGTLMSPENSDLRLPLIFTEPETSRGYFRKIDQFLVDTLGEEVRHYYTIIENDPVQVARVMHDGVADVAVQRRANRDAFYYNWSLRIPVEMLVPFDVTHESMAALKLTLDQPAAELVVNLRRVFSGIVAGNVKDQGVRLVREHGPFVLKGEAKLMRAIDELLQGFVADGRMKIQRERYHPCYTIEAPQMADSPD